MSIELLVLRSADNYLRLREDGFEICGLEKASVFPLAKHQYLRETIQRLSGEGIDLRLHKLTILEEPYQEK